MEKKPAVKFYAMQSCSSGGHLDGRDRTLVNGNYVILSSKKNDSGFNQLDLRFYWVEMDYGDYVAFQNMNSLGYLDV